MKTIQGILFLAMANKSLTLLAPTPTNISTKSEPLIEKKGTLASPATAFANKVLPVPGGPTKSTPLGIFAPRAENLRGFLRNSTTSLSSSFSSSAPATSVKRTLIFCVTRAFVLPKSIAPFPPPPICRIRNINTSTPRTSIIVGMIRLDQKEPEFGSAQS